MRIWYQSYVDYEHAGPYWDILRGHLNRVADPGTEIVVHGITPHDSDAHRLMEWRCAREMICNAVVAERQGYDAFIIGHFQDAGLYEARGAVDIPVLGLGETSMLHGCMLGRRLGLVMLKAQYRAWFHEQIARYGLGERVVAMRAVTIDPALFAAAHGSAESRAELYRQFSEQVRPMVAEGVEVLLPTGGGPMALLAGLGRVDGAPVLDGTAIIVKQAEAAVKLRALNGLGASRVGAFARAAPQVIEQFLTYPKGL